MRRSQFDQEGCLIINQQGGPGLPGMPPVFERATKTCAHCGTPVVVEPRRVRARGHCRKCNDFICDPCVLLQHIHGCVPFAKVIDQLEKELRHG